jgi:hypothetical protein
MTCGSTLDRETGTLCREFLGQTRVDVTNQTFATLITRNNSFADTLIAQPLANSPISPGLLVKRINGQIANGN